MGDGSTVVKLPSRAIPAFAIVIAICTILGSVGCCFYYGHDFGGTYWPYISDTAKSMPQAGFFSYGMSVTSVLIVVTVLVHHGKLKLNLYALADGPDGADKVVEGFRRAKVARVAGCFAGPNLGLLACYDTERSPHAHLLFVLLFFIPCLVYLACVISVYSLMVKKLDARRARGAPRLRRVSYVSLETSLRWKRRIGVLFTFFFTLYLPVGMALVSDWYDYRKDVTVHTFRALCQHATVISLVLFFGTMWHDFGDLRFRIGQSA